MINRPFLGEAKNVYNETTHTSAPATIGNNNIMVTQSQNRNVCDTTLTSVAGYPQFQFNNTPCCLNQCISPTPSPVVTQRTPIPGGVLYTFNPQTRNYLPQCCSNCDPQYVEQLQRAYQQYGPYLAQQQAQRPLTLNQQIALKGLEMQGLENLFMQDYLRQNPYKLQLHYNQQTSTSELFNLGNQIGSNHPTMDQTANQNLIPGTCGCPNNPNMSPTKTRQRSKGKALYLTKSPDLTRTPNPDDFDEAIKQSHENEKMAVTEILTGTEDDTSRFKNANTMGQSKRFADQEIQTDGSKKVSFNVKKLTSPKAKSAPNVAKKSSKKKKKSPPDQDCSESDEETDISTASSTQSSKSGD